MKVINLLPKSKQEELHYEALFHSISIAATLGVASMILVVILEIGLGIYLNRQSKNVAMEIEQIKKLSNKEENAQLKAEIEAINSRLKDYQDLSKAAPLWSNALHSFAADVPEGVKITSFTADTAKKQIDISGYAPTRDLVIQLYNKVNEDKEHFRDINYPLENVAKPADIDFHFTFFVQDKVLMPDGESK